MPTKRGGGREHCAGAKSKGDSKSPKIDFQAVLKTKMPTQTLALVKQLNSEMSN